MLPRVRLEEIEGVGHMAPVTHPDTFNPLIERFLEATQPSLAGDVPNAKAHLLKRNVRQPSAEAPMLQQGDLVPDVAAGDLF